MKGIIANELQDINFEGNNLSIRILTFRYSLHTKVKNNFINKEFIDTNRNIFEGNLHYYSFNTFLFNDDKIIMQPINLPSR